MRWAIILTSCDHQRGTKGASSAPATSKDALNHGCTERLVHQTGTKGALSAWGCYSGSIHRPPVDQQKRPTRGPWETKETKMMQRAIILTPCRPAEKANETTAKWLRWKPTMQGAMDLTSCRIAT
eukprot:1159496-Pelagomonas_calceolata.AAC.11